MLKTRKHTSVSKMTAAVLILILVATQVGGMTASASGYDNFGKEINYRYSQRSYGQGALGLGADNKGKCTIEADITPLSSNMECYLGYADGSTQLNPALAVPNVFPLIIRFNSNGTIDSYNGSLYQASSSISYAAGTKYHFRVEADIGTRKYSIWVSSGETETKIADNYSFSSSAPAIDDLGQVCFYTPAAAKTAKLENHVIYPTALYAPAESQITVYPREINDVLHNPGMGWIYYDNAVSNFSDLGASGTFPEVDNIGIVSTWAELEPAEGSFNWSKLDAAINYWVGQGKRIHLRVSTETTLIKAKAPYVTYNAGVPQWVYNLGVAKTTRKVDSYNCDFPDYNNSTYIQKMTNFVNTLANRYKNNTNIDVVDLRGYGINGGWNSGYDFSGLANRQQKLAQIIDIWANAWGSKTLILPVSKEWRNNAADPNAGQMYPVEPTGNLTFSQYMQYNAVDYALSKPTIGLGFDAMSGGLRDVEREVFLKFFRSNRGVPITYDFASAYPVYNAVGGRRDSIDPSRKYNPETAYEDAIKNHPNYLSLMGNDRFGDAKKFYDKRGDLIKKGNLELGYRFVLNKISYPGKVEPGTSFAVKQKWSNEAFGRCYGKYPVKVYLTREDGTTVWSAVDTSFDQRAFVKDETYDITSHLVLGSTVPSGTYDLRLAMVDDSGNPAIRLAIQGMDSQKRYRIGKITVGSTVEGFEGGSFAASDYTAGWQGNYGQVTSDINRRITGTYSAYASVNSTDAWHEFLYSDTNKVKLEPGATYEVTFKGKTITNFTNGGYGYFSVRSTTGGAAQDVGFNSWTDTSGSVYTKTFTFTLKDYPDYYLLWGVRNSGAMSIDDIKIRKISGATGEGFESGAFTSTRYMQGAAGGVVTTTGSQVISGTKSVYASSSVSSDSWHEFLQTDPGKFPLEANATYAITFKSKTLSDLGTNGYFYFYAYSPTGGHGKDKGDIHWFDKSGYGTGTRTIILTLGNYADYRLIWGIRNGGSVSVDDIRVDKLQSTQYEGFEGGTWNSTKCIPAWNGAVLLNNQAGLINGTYSVGPDMNNFMAYTMGNEFLRTDNRRGTGLPAGKQAIYFDEDATYTITFKVKQNTDGKPGSYNYIVARSDMADAGYIGVSRWSTLSSLNEVETKTITFRTNYHYMYDINDYYLVWGICSSGNASVDEITVTRD